jgi:hypothetical protein
VNDVEKLLVVWEQKPIPKSGKERTFFTYFAILCLTSNLRPILCQKETSEKERSFRVRSLPTNYF